MTIEYSHGSNCSNYSSVVDIYDQLNAMLTIMWWVLEIKDATKEIIHWSVHQDFWINVQVDDENAKTYICKNWWFGDRTRWCH